MHQANFKRLHLYFSCSLPELWATSQGRPWTEFDVARKPSVARRRDADENGFTCCSTPERVPWGMESCWNTLDVSPRGQRRHHKSYTWWSVHKPWLWKRPRFGCRADIRKGISKMNGALLHSHPLKIFHLPTVQPGFSNKDYATLYKDYKGLLNLFNHCFTWAFPLWHLWLEQRFVINIGLS
jgi:hypothetical protein